MPAHSIKKLQEAEVISLDVIERRIIVLRGHRVMLDRDLATLYRVETRTLNQAVKRNLDRFPSDFMFRLTPKEAIGQPSSRSQSVILKRGENVKYLPYVFTEHGAVMLANVLKSGPAVRASIQVVRAFVRMRQTRHRTPARIHDPAHDPGAAPAPQTNHWISRQSNVITL